MWIRSTVGKWFTVTPEPFWRKNLFPFAFDCETSLVALDGQHVIVVHSLVSCFWIRSSCYVVSLVSATSSFTVINHHPFLQPPSFFFFSKTSTSQPLNLSPSTTRFPCFLHYRSIQLHTTVIPSIHQSCLTPILLYALLFESSSLCW